MAKGIARGLIAVSLIYFSFGIQSANAVLNPEESMKISEKNCYLTIGHFKENQDTGGNAMDIQVENNAYCITDAKLSSTGSAMKPTSACTFTGFDMVKGELTDPILNPQNPLQQAGTFTASSGRSCSNGGFKEVLKVKMEHGKTLRDYLFDGPDGSGMKPIVVSHHDAAIYSNFSKHHKTFVSDLKNQGEVQSAEEVISKRRAIEDQANSGGLDGMDREVAAMNLSPEQIKDLNNTQDQILKEALWDSGCLDKKTDPFTNQPVHVRYYNKYDEAQTFTYSLFFKTKKCEGQPLFGTKTVFRHETKAPIDSKNSKQVNKQLQANTIELFVFDPAYVKILNDKKYADRADWNLTEPRVVTSRWADGNTEKLSLYRSKDQGKDKTIALTKERLDQCFDGAKESARDLKPCIELGKRKAPDKRELAVTRNAIKTDDKVAKETPQK